MNYLVDLNLKAAFNVAQLVVKKIIKRPDVGNDKVNNGHNTPGNDVEYEVDNDTKNAKPGNKLRKSLEQIKVKPKT